MLSDMALLTAPGVWEISGYHFQTCSAKETYGIDHRLVHETPCGYRS